MKKLILLSMLLTLSVVAFSQVSFKPKAELAYYFNNKINGQNLGVASYRLGFDIKASSWKLSVDNKSYQKDYKKGVAIGLWANDFSYRLSRSISTKWSIGFEQHFVNTFGLYYDPKERPIYSMQQTAIVISYGY